MVNSALRSRCKSVRCITNSALRAFRPPAPVLFPAFRLRVDDGLFGNLARAILAAMIWPATRSTPRFREDGHDSMGFGSNGSHASEGEMVSAIETTATLESFC
jgi:hypothetical protein